MLYDDAMKTYTVQLHKASYKPEHRGTDSEIGNAIRFSVRVIAQTRTDAVLKALPQIAALHDKLQGKYLSVFVGTDKPSEYPMRCMPIQIDLETMTLRRR